jgi:hypothetical protein
LLPIVTLVILSIIQYTPILVIMKHIKRVLNFFRSLQRSAVIESGKIMFSVIGIGTVTANIWVAGKLFFIPAILIFLSGWYALYTQMEGV